MQSVPVVENVDWRADDKVLVLNQRLKRDGSSSRVNTQRTDPHRQTTHTRAYTLKNPSLWSKMWSDAGSSLVVKRGAGQFQLALGRALVPVVNHIHDT